MKLRRRSSAGSMPISAAAWLTRRSTAYAISGRPGAAIGADGRRVRDRNAIRRVERRDLVDARHAVGRIAYVPLRARREVRAQVDDPVDAHRQELPVLVERELAVGDHVAAVRVGQQAFRARASPLHRRAERFRGDHERRVFRIGARALAEAAADVAHLEDELLRRHLRVVRELRAQRGDALHRGVDPVRFRRRVVGDEARPRLHGIRRHARRDRLWPA